MSSGMASGSTPAGGGAGISIVTRSPAATRCEARREAASTCTRPSSTSDWMRARLRSGSCETRKRSRRCPASSAETTKDSLRAASIPASPSSSSMISSGPSDKLGSVREGMMSAGDCTDRRALNRSVAAQAAPPEEGPGENQREAHELHKRNRIVKHQRAARIVAQKFDRAALDPVEDEIRAEQLAGKTLPRADPHEQQEIQELRARFVELRRMERNIQRRA